jgi:hypothetical protein
MEEPLACTPTGRLEEGNRRRNGSRLSRRVQHVTAGAPVGVVGHDDLEHGRPSRREGATALRRPARLSSGGVAVPGPKTPRARAVR